MLKSVVRAVGAAVRVSSLTVSTTRAFPSRCPTLCAPSSATARPFTRSLWMLNNRGASDRPKLFTSKVFNPSVSCACGGLHTEGNARFWLQTVLCYKREQINYVVHKLLVNVAFPTYESFSH